MYGHRTWTIRPRWRNLASFISERFLEVKWIHIIFINTGQQRVCILNEWNIFFCLALDESLAYVSKTKSKANRTILDYEGISLWFMYRNLKNVSRRKKLRCIKNMNTWVKKKILIQEHFSTWCKSREINLSCTQTMHCPHEFY